MIGMPAPVTHIEFRHGLSREQLNHAIWSVDPFQRYPKIDRYEGYFTGPWEGSDPRFPSG
jgi:hypothetical protein